MDEVHLNRLPHRLLKQEAEDRNQNLLKQQVQRVKLKAFQVKEMDLGQ